MFEPSLELASASHQFRGARKRWPKDYEELSGFLKESDDEKFMQLQAVRFHSIRFAELPDGKLKIDADYSVDSANVRIDGMQLTAFDIDDTN